MTDEQRRTAIQDAADELKALSRKAFWRLIRNHKSGWIARWLEETSEQHEKGVCDDT